LRSRSAFLAQPLTRLPPLGGGFDLVRGGDRCRMGFALRERGGAGERVA